MVCGPLLASVVGLMPTSLSAQCRLCIDETGGSTYVIAEQADQIPLRIEITANLDFSRLALLNHSGGEVSIDPISGNRRVSGAVTDLGGMSLNGEGRLAGEPGRYVRIHLPERIILSAPNGSTAEVVKLDTNLPAQVKLDRTGHLKFAFGGKLRVKGNTGGQYRGRIAITADYE